MVSRRKNYPDTVTEAEMLFTEVLSRDIIDHIDQKNNILRQIMLKLHAELVERDDRSVNAILEIGKNLSYLHEDHKEFQNESRESNEKSSKEISGLTAKLDIFAKNIVLEFSKIATRLDAVETNTSQIVETNNLLIKLIDAVRSGPAPR